MIVIFYLFFSYAIAGDHDTNVSDNERVWRQRLSDRMSTASCDNEEVFKLIRNLETKGQRFPELTNKSASVFDNSELSDTRRLFLCASTYLSLYARLRGPHAIAALQAPLSDPAPLIIRVSHNLGVISYQLSLVDDLWKKEGMHPEVAKERLGFLVQAAERGFVPSILALRSLPAVDKTWLLARPYQEPEAKQRLFSILQIEREDCA